MKVIDIRPATRAACDHSSGQSSVFPSVPIMFLMHVRANSRLQPLCRFSLGWRGWHTACLVEPFKHPRHWFHQMMPWCALALPNNAAAFLAGWVVTVEVEWDVDARFFVVDGCVKSSREYTVNLLDELKQNSCMHFEDNERVFFSLWLA